MAIAQPSIATGPLIAGSYASTAAPLAASARRFVIALLLAGLVPIPVFALLSGALATNSTAQSTYHVV